MDLGLDQADKIASVVGALVAVIALVVTVRQIRGQQHRVAAGQGPGTRPQAWVIAALAGVAGCVLGSCGVISVASKLGNGRTGDDDPTGGPANRSRAATAPAGPVAAPVLWQGEVRLDGTPRDFDFEPPKRGNTSIDLDSDGYLNGSAYDSFWGSGVVLWTGEAGPSRDDCADRLETHGQEAVDIDARSRICLKTNQGRIVFLKVLRRDGDGYLAEATLWASS